MKRIYKVYKKTVSIVNETPTAMYENLVGSRKGFLLESYDKNYDRYTFLGEPEELISRRGSRLSSQSGEREVRRGNPLALLKEYYDEFEIHKENDELNFPADWWAMSAMILSATRKNCRRRIRMRSGLRRFS